MDSLVTPLIDIKTAEGLLHLIVPQWQELLEDIEAQGGRFAFRPELAKTFSNLKIGNYPRLYENEVTIGVALGLAFLGRDGLKSYDEQLRRATPVERGQMVQELSTGLDELKDAFDFDKTPEQLEQARAAFEALTADERTASTEFMQWLLMGTFALFFQYLSIMVHGEKLTALVAQAKAGDDKAFLKAIQIDKAILSEIEYFKSRHVRAHMEDERAFITAVARKQEAPPYAGKLTHKKLWLSFAWLDSTGLLDSYTGNQLLDLCTEVGVIDDTAPIEDVKNLLKLKSRYRAFQKRGGKSTP
ncbi:MAG: hypothetical protein ACAH06_13165 [Methylophilaceae bacterium]